ncbi:MAG: hypothetical protein ACI8QC_001235 [Planctomycetota bacterium]|jgi:hypothetical protein
MKRSTLSRPLLALVATLASCASIVQPDARWKDDATGTRQFGISSGWAFAEADVELENGTGPLADPAIGGNPNGASTADLDPVFGLGLKYLYYLDNNWSIGGIAEYRIFDPDSTRPLSADVDLDDFGTTHYILDLRYSLDAMGPDSRWRPFAAFQVGYIPEIKADGTVHYGDAFDALGFPDHRERISLEGDDFWTLGVVAGASYILREGLSLDMAVFYERAITATEADLELTPQPGVGILGETSTYAGSLEERGLYLSFGLSWYF